MTQVRPAGPGGWEAAARVYTAACPHDPLGGAELHRRDAEQRAWGYRTVTLVAENSAQVVGMASLFQNPGAYHPDRYTLELAVQPDWQGRSSHCLSRSTSSQTKRSTSRME